MKRGLELSIPTSPSVKSEPVVSGDTSISNGNIDFDSTDLFDLMDFVGGGNLAALLIVVR